MSRPDGNALADALGIRVRTLPFTTDRNVGFGFNRIDVAGAAPGTVCRVLVDGAVREGCGEGVAVASGSRAASAILSMARAGAAA